MPNWRNWKAEREVIVPRRHYRIREHTVMLRWKNGPWRLFCPRDGDEVPLAYPENLAEALDQLAHHLYHVCKYNRKETIVDEVNILACGCAEQTVRNDRHQCDRFNGLPADAYPWIRKVGQALGSLPGYIAEQIERARADKAPLDATSEISLGGMRTGKWRTAADMGAWLREELGLPPSKVRCPRCGNDADIDRDGHLKRHYVCKDGPVCIGMGMSAQRARKAAEADGKAQP
ncbi:hypothetical protein [Amycolatopsis anabasis]|uniref:hypothetical protein n=1 Tax=Amycolatopsis anabasis TaxID=1840409 RepID=UPI00131D0DCF|nr:hypothetical protein [Amycolatopsis anabasis]